MEHWYTDSYGYISPWLPIGLFFSVIAIIVLGGYLFFRHMDRADQKQDDDNWAYIHGMGYPDRGDVEVFLRMQELDFQDFIDSESLRKGYAEFTKGNLPQRKVTRESTSTVVLPMWMGK